MNVYKKDLSEAIEAETALLQKCRVSPLGWVPVVAVGKVSKTRYSVGINYQPSGVRVGDTFVPPHSEDLIDGILRVVAVK